MEFKIGDKFEEYIWDNKSGDETPYIYTILFRAPTVDTWDEQELFVRVDMGEEFWYTAVTEAYLEENTEEIK
ncbi:hypothetical protein FP76_gp253 [Bacillus phage Evoli]|uniref:Uncharacterized protein n=2 Tax=Bastillevirus TaxID=1918010 RepID=A0A024B0Y8_9CAUD|nr:hypothetical protein FP76_gp253 [Bacillus phage Evoli]AHZ09841.1 hypothetical protein [Bacillus phage Evoli]ASU00966.1 hypothetical protein ANTHONY_126 [Bacillus phage Anthony]